MIGEGARPLTGATVRVVGAEPPCAARTVADGSFTITSAAVGPRAVEAASGSLPPWRHDAIDLQPDQSGSVAMRVQVAVPC